MLPTYMPLGNFFTLGHSFFPLTLCQSTKLLFSSLTKVDMTVYCVTNILKAPLQIAPFQSPLILPVWKKIQFCVFPEMSLCKSLIIIGLNLTINSTGVPELPGSNSFTQQTISPYFLTCEQLCTLYCIYCEPKTALKIKSNEGRGGEEWEEQQRRGNKDLMMPISAGTKSEIFPDPFLFSLFAEHLIASLSVLCSYSCIFSSSYYFILVFCRSHLLHYLPEGRSRALHC